MAEQSLDSRSSTGLSRNSKDYPGHAMLRPTTSLNDVLSVDPETPVPVMSDAWHPASFDLAAIQRDPKKLVDAQIIECDRTGRYILKSYDKAGLFQRLQSAPIIEASPTNKLTLKEALAMKYGSLLREESFPSDSDVLTGSEPFSNFTPLFMGPYYRNQYMYKMLELKSKCYEAFNNNPVGHRIPNIITQFTLGKGVTMVCKSDKTRKVWSDFASLNKLGTSMNVGLTRAGSRLRMWSNQLSVDGEMFWQFMPTREGLKIKYIDSATILDVVTDPEDMDDVKFYHQQFCLEGGTRISLMDGTEPTIKDMVDRFDPNGPPMWVYSFDLDTQKVVPGKVIGASKQGVKKCWEVTLDNGEKVVASYDHPFLLRDGTYVWASKLTPGTSLMPLYRRSGYEDVYQPNGTWEPTHHVVARTELGLTKTKGIVLHHKDGNRRNNVPSNICAMKHAEHTKLTFQECFNDPSTRGDWFRANRSKKSSAASKASWKRKGYADTLVAAQKASWVKNRANRLAALRKSWTDPAVRERHVKGIRDCWADPEFRVRQIAAMKAGWANPEGRERRIAKMVASKAALKQRGKWAKFSKKSNAQSAGYMNHKVVSVKPVGTRTVYDLTVDKYHNFALTAGVFTHNTTALQQFVKGNIPSTMFIVRDIPANQVLHVKINTYENEKRGRSDLASIIGWLKRLKDLVNANVIKAYFQACYTWDYTIDGSPATVETIANAYKNIIPTPGSSYFHNKNIVRAPNPPVGGTGAGSDSDMMGLMNLIAMGAGIPPSYLIGAMSSNRAAVLTETEPSTKFFFERQSVWDETLHAFYDRLSRWHYDQTGEMLDDSVEFSFPAINAVERMAAIQALTQMKENKWFKNSRCAELAAKEFSVTSYNFETEQKDIDKEATEQMHRDLEKQKAQSAAQSHLSLWQNILSDTAANEERGILGHNVGDPSPEEMAAMQQQQGGTNGQSKPAGGGSAKPAAAGKPKPKPATTKSQSTSGGVTETERARTTKQVKSNPHD